MNKTGLMTLEICVFGQRKSQHIETFSEIQARVIGRQKIYNRQGREHTSRDATAFRISGQDRTRDASDGVWSSVRTAGDASKGGDGSGRPNLTADSPLESGSALLHSRLWSSSSEAASRSCFFEAPDVSRNRSFVLWNQTIDFHWFQHRV